MSRRFIEDLRDFLDAERKTFLELAEAGMEMSPSLSVQKQETLRMIVEDGFKETGSAVSLKEAVRDVCADMYGDGSIQANITIKRLNGFIDEHKHLPETVLVEDVESSYIEQEPKVSAVLPASILNAPSFVGEISIWITSTAPSPQPALSLGAAIAAVGVLKGRTRQSDSGFRTNHYVLGIAGSSSGKDWPRKCITKLFKEIGAPVIGKPASDSGLIGSLAEAHGVALGLWDEIGYLIQALTHRNAVTFEKRIRSVMLELFSSADGVFIGKELADRKHKTIEIDQPCLGIFGTTTPHTIYDGLTQNDIADGFLPRCLLFQVEDNDVLPNLFVSPALPPKELAERALKLKQLDIHTTKHGNIPVIDPVIIPFSQESRAMVKEFFQYTYDRKKKTREDGDSYPAIWGRAYEHMVKLALTIEEGSEIGLESVKWAIEVSSFVTRMQCDIVEKVISENDTQKEIKKLLQVIASRPGISRSQLTNFVNNRYLTKKLDEYLDHLGSTNQIITAQKRNGKRGRPGLYYYINNFQAIEENGIIPIANA